MNYQDKTYDELHSLLKEKRIAYKQLEAEMAPIIEEINDRDRKERAQRQQDRERQQWLTEFTARQAYYHSR